MEKSMGPWRTAVTAAEVPHGANANFRGSNPILIAGGTSACGAPRQLGLAFCPAPAIQSAPRSAATHKSAVSLQNSNRLGNFSAASLPPLHFPVPFLLLTGSHTPSRQTRLRPGRPSPETFPPACSPHQQPHILPAVCVSVSKRLMTS